MVSHWACNPEETLALFLKAEPHSTGTKALPMVPVRSSARSFSSLGACATQAKQDGEHLRVYSPLICHTLHVPNKTSCHCCIHYASQGFSPRGN